MSYFRRAAARISGLASLPAFAFVLASTFAGSASAFVELRVEAKPADQPIQAFVIVTNLGVPVPGLAAADFTIRIDGQLITIADPDVTLPPAQDPNQKLSVVFVMDYSTSVTTLFRPQMEAAVIAFIDRDEGRRPGGGGQVQCRQSLGRIDRCAIHRDRYRRWQRHRSRLPYCRITRAMERTCWMPSKSP